MDSVAVVSAAATAISAGVIAWQAWLTRRAVHLSRELLAETQFTRLDATAPRVLLSVQEYPSNAGAAMRKFTFGGGGFEDVPEETLFTLPRHEECEIRWDFVFTVTNDGPGSVVPDFESGASIWVHDAGTLIPAGQTHEFTVSVLMTVEQWMRAAETHRDTPAPVVQTIRMSVDGPNDSDVSDEWTIDVFGSLLDHPLEDRVGWTYMVGPFWGSIRVESKRKPRTYWRSRAGKKKL